MTHSLASLTFLVREYEEAVAFFTDVLGFELVEDTALGPGKRWVVVRLRGGQGATLLLGRAATDEQRAQVGNQAGGRVFLFLHTDDFWRDLHRMRERGVRFTEEPRDEPYGTVVVFLDCYGTSGTWSSCEAGRREAPLAAPRRHARQVYNRKTRLHRELVTRAGTTPACS